MSDTAWRGWFVVWPAAWTATWHFETAQVDAALRPTSGRVAIDAALLSLVARTERTTRWIARWLHRLKRLGLTHPCPGDTCLVRALAVVHAARRAGYGATLQLGARRENDHVAAHAWATLGAVPLTDPGQDMVPFTTTDA